jgi:hypothetical protein
MRVLPNLNRDYSNGLVRRRIRRALCGGSFELGLLAAAWIFRPPRLRHLGPWARQISRIILEAVSILQQLAKKRRPASPVRHYSRATRGETALRVGHGQHCRRLYSEKSSLGEGRGRTRGRCLATP